ncbi:hypothetical protein RclHR1_00450005 [Rhizophagus clarus]|uniref:Uncharacterized protein n=1 Tax=Rhizophagus clarus TaxID=94130 RepID=A0A2Z6RZ59_9GLOM|nr:hypothetical protein RclHR1_00450005 [Rhizophagus clarus]
MLKNSPGLSTSKGLELHFEADHFKSETPFKVDHFKSRNSISRQTTLRSQNSILRQTTLRVQNSFRVRLYDISKIQTFYFEDWTLFEDLVTIFEDYFEGPDEAQIPFKDPGRQNTVYLSKIPLIFGSAVGFLEEISKVWGFLERYEILKVYGFWTKFSKVYGFL